MESSMAQLLLDVPSSVRKIYMEVLDVKSAAMLVCTCSKYAQDKVFVKNKKHASMIKLFDDFVSLGQSTYEYLNSVVAQNAMMSDILRKLIYTSVTIDYHTDEAAMHGPQLCYQEYQTICHQLCEELQITWFKCNTLLENAQFEYRGYNIIGLNERERELLDTVKDKLHSRYFGDDDDEISINIYAQLGDFYIDLQFCNSEITLDVYKNTSEDKWEYVGDLVTADDILHSNISMQSGTFVWNMSHTCQTKYIVDLIEKHFADNKLLTGGGHSSMSIWSNETENCFILREVINQHKMLRGYENDVSYLANQFKFAYTFP